MFISSSRGKEFIILLILIGLMCKSGYTQGKAEMCIICVQVWPNGKWIKTIYFTFGIANMMIMKVK
jgi:hypothetical protein